MATSSLIVSGYQWPSPQYDALEGFLYEGGDRVSGDVKISEIAANCRNRTSPDSNVAAEWLRFAYHDMATHNITDGTGGLDASIFYELDRPENIGDGMQNTVSDFRFTATKYVSLPILSPLLPSGGWHLAEVHKSSFEEDGQMLQVLFRLQGFTRAEMITLVACGHTIGAVRSADFPDVAKPNPLDRFDRTRRCDNHRILGWFHAEPISYCLEHYF
ncbi:heme peroxidase [Flammula alnicola]|nr:heme peroxidase [Flammula alnicola]